MAKYKDIKPIYELLEAGTKKVERLDELDVHVRDRAHNSILTIEIEKETLTVDLQFILDEIARQKTEILQDVDKQEKKLKIV